MVDLSIVMLVFGGVRGPSNFGSDMKKAQAVCRRNHGFQEIFIPPSGNPKKVYRLHPRKLTYPPKNDYFSREYIFQPLIFRGHVSFQGSTGKTFHASSFPEIGHRFFRLRGQCFHITSSSPGGRGARRTGAGWRKNLFRLRRKLHYRYIFKKDWELDPLPNPKNS